MVGNAVIKQRPVKTGESVISTSPTPMSRSLDLDQNNDILKPNYFKKQRSLSSFLYLPKIILQV